MPGKNSKKNRLISNRYKITKKIASGGMADVFLGKDLKLGRKVAIKILSANYASDRNFVARFKSEAQILSKLDHPNIIKVFGWGKYSDSYYICMEYIEGKNLKEVIEQRGPLPPDIIADYATQICGALIAAHKNNLIHRDIKSQNILINQEGEVRVTDFGIAKSLNTDLTKTLNIIGTAHYISPEQAKGEVLDRRTDIYSLGIILYEMLTADVPFRGENSIEISFKHVNQKLVKPSGLIKDVPRDLEKIIIHCLEKIPSMRYSDAAELKEDLQNFLSKKPIKLGKKTKDSKEPGVFLKRARTHAYSIFITALMLVFMALFLFYSIRFYDQGPVIEDTVTVPPIENIPAERARDILEVSGLDLVISEEQYSSTVPQGFIIEQSPLPDMDLTPGSSIEAVVSKGEEIKYIIVPNLIGLPVGDVLEIIESYGLEKGNIDEVYSNDFNKDAVMAQNPGSGEEVETRRIIDLTVSKGIEIMIIPNIVGQDYLYASGYLQSLGLKIKFSKVPVDSTINEPGKVKGMFPAAGSEVAGGSLVEILVTTSEALIEIPDLVQMNLDQAKGMLEAGNIKYEISYFDADYSVQEGIVSGQIPEPGTYIGETSSIIIFVGE